MKFCQNCGNQLADDARFCEHCGASVVVTEVEEIVNEETPVVENEVGSEPQTVITEEEQPPIIEKKKFVFSKKLMLISVGVVALLIVLGIVIGNAVSLGKYEEKLESAYDSMKSGAESAESYATLQSKVWRNCIYEQSSSETDEYTTDEYGDYYSDFNDALSEFFEGENLTYMTVSLNVSTVDTYMSELKDCPKKFEDKYRSLKELYIAYSDLTDLVVGSSSYSYNTFSEALEEAKADYKRALSSAKLLLE